MVTCDGREHGEPPRWHAAAAFGVVRTTLVLSGHHVEFAQHSLSASVERAVGDRFVLQIGGGAILGGTLTVGNTAHVVEPGWVLSAGFSYRLIDESRRRPFALFTYGFGLGGALTHPRGDASRTTALTAVDLARVGITTGKTFGAVTPFAAARVFGGPVFWKIDGAAVTGGDRYHFQLATGVSVRPGAGFDAFAEWAFAGERRVSIGVGGAF